MSIHCCKEGYEGGCYVLPPLPFDVSAYEPLLDEKTVRLHHDIHHAAYVVGANNALSELRAIAQGEGKVNATSCATDNLAFNLGGHLLHCLYWHSLCSVEQTPGLELMEALQSQFGSMEGFFRIFRAAALGIQGSGWALLARECLSKRLIVLSVHRHQDALVSGIKPLLACDVWEHAYYLRYQNNRAAYVDAFLRHINWKWVTEQFNHSMHLAV